MTKRQPLKKSKKTASQKKASTPSRNFIADANLFFEKHRWKAMAFLFLLSLFISIIYYLQARNSPVMVMHEWDNSDMKFFDTWAKHINAGDWWGDETLHPYHDWHDILATE